MRWVFRLLGLVVVLIIVAVVGLMFLPAERIARLAESRFEAATGRALTIGGDVSPSFWPNIGVKTGPLSIANAEWSDNGPMLEAEALSVAVELIPLISGDIRIKGVDLAAPRILLETNAQGAGNWEFGSGEDAAAAGSDSSAGGVPGFSLDQAVISDGMLTYAPAGGAATRLESVDATVSVPDFDGAASVALTAQSNGADVALNTTIAEFAAFLNGGVSGIDAEFSAGGASLDFDGRAGISPAPAAEGALSGNLDNLAGLMAALGQAAPSLPSGLGRDTLRVSSSITYTGDTLNLRDLALTLDQNTISGAADVVLGGDRPKLRANLALGAFDLSGASTGGGAQRDSSGTTTGWSRDPIDVSALSTLDADLSLTADSLALGTTQLNRTSLLVTLDNARAVAEIRELTAYDGSVGGSVVVNGRGGLSSRVNVSGSALAISRLLNELVGWDRLIAAGDVSLNVLGSGNSMHALMNSLNGEGSFRVGAGELLGLDIVGMLRNLDMSFIGDGSSTIFDDITGSFRVVDGVMIYDSLAMNAPLFMATGDGQIGLGGQTLDLRIVPQLLGDNGIRVPLLISGSWSAPKFRLDLEALARENLGEQVDQAVEQVQESARQAIADELGLEEGEDAEDAARDRLENELRDGLRGLLGD